MYGGHAACSSGRIGRERGGTVSVIQLVVVAVGVVLIAMALALGKPRKA